MALNFRNQISFFCENQKLFAEEKNKNANENFKFIGNKCNNKNEYFSTEKSNLAQKENLILLMSIKFILLFCFSFVRIITVGDCLSGNTITSCVQCLQNA